MKSIWKKGLILMLVCACLVSVVAGCSGAPSVESDTPAQSDVGITTGEDRVTTTNADTAYTTDPSAISTETAATVIGGNSTTNTKSSATTTTAAKGSTTTKPTTSAVSKNYYVNSTGKVYQNFTFDYEAVAASYTVDNKYNIQDLGAMQLEEYPLDGVYDHSFNCIKVGDTYKMWWCRACPYDTIWYAESKDMKNWYNAQLIIDLNGYSTTYIKQMLAWPSVLYVNGKYHMFFESPAKIGETTEYSNNIFYATSSDGTNWTFYPNNKNPQPVIKDPVIKEGVYGVGQPKAFYKDGYFYVTYTDAATTSAGNIRIARSKGNGFSFEGNSVNDHPILISNVAGAAVRYNSANSKYYMTFSMSETQSNGVYNDNVYMMETADLYKWPCDTRAQALLKASCLTRSNNVSKKANVDFVTNEQGIIDSENMVLMYMDGVMPSASEDHRNTHTTWDGHIAVVGAGSKYGKTLTLPNGKDATAANLKWYANQIATWRRPSASVAHGTPVIDGKKDAVYGQGDTALIETVTWSYEYSKPTDTTGTINFAWDADALYVYAEIKDKTGPYTGYVLEKPGNLWRNDGICIFIDVPDTKTGTTNQETLTPLTFMALIDASGTFIVKDSSETICTSDFPGYSTETKKTSDGYIVEAKIPWYSMVKDQIKSGKTIGLDVQINDSFNDTVGRQAQVFWSDYTGDSFLYLDRYGQLKLK